MQALQRMLMIIMAAVIFLYLTEITLGDRQERLVSQWEGLYSERFINRICESGTCTYEEYQRYYTVMYQLYGKVSVFLNEYQREWDIGGKEYRFMLSWPEIKKYMSEEGEYCFKEESIIELIVQAEGAERHLYQGRILREVQ